MKEYKHVVASGENGWTVEQILREAGFTKKEISRQKFLPRGILVDGHSARSTGILKAGQCLELHFMEKEIETAKASAGLPELLVCYEDEEVLIVNKPSGVACHPGRGHYEDNLGSQVMEYCQKKGEYFSIREIGRLDKDTSGLVVFAKSQLSAARLWKQREEGDFKKWYEAVVYGTFPEKEGTIALPMKKVPGEQNKMQTAKEGMEAVTHYRVIREWTAESLWKFPVEISDDACFSLVECTLETGRTHQIRVHMEGAGHPLLGDTIYGKQEKAERLYLHARKVSLLHPFTGTVIEVTTPGFQEMMKTEPLDALLTR